jgi:voltage-dependent potassium channel beta subunit
VEYRRLGKSGLKLSCLSFGSWVTFKNQVDYKNALELMSFAYDRGVNFFDNAEVYAEGESEKIMGRVLKKLSWSRDSFVVSSKVFWGGDKPSQRGLSRKHIFDACHSALNRLGVDYLDLFFCHRPDPETPIEESVAAMSDLVRQGKILYWGTSEWTSEDINKAYDIAIKNYLVPPVMEQPEYNIFHRTRVEKEYKELYQKIGLGTTIWSPLASGILTGKYKDTIPKTSRANLTGYERLKERVLSQEGIKQIKVTEKISLMAKEIGLTSSQLAILWCLRNKNVSTVILGASKIGQLKENLEAIEHLDKMTDAIYNKINQLLPQQ